MRGILNLKRKLVILSEMQTQDAKAFQSLSTLNAFQAEMLLESVFETYFHIAFLRILPSALNKHLAVLGPTGFIGQAMEVSEVLSLRCSLRERTWLSSLWVYAKRNSSHLPLSMRIYYNSSWVLQIRHFTNIFTHDLS